MGPFRLKDLNEHLKEVHDQTYAYLQQEMGSSSGLTGKQGMMLRLATMYNPDTENVILQPEPLTIYEQLRATGTQMWPGGLWGQPYILTQELLEVHNAKTVFKNEQDIERQDALEAALRNQK